MELPVRDPTTAPQQIRLEAAEGSTPALSPAASLAPRGRLLAIPAPSGLQSTPPPSQQRTAPVVIAPAIALVCAAVVAYCSTEVKTVGPQSLAKAEPGTVERIAFQYSLPVFQERLQQWVMPQQPVLAPDPVVPAVAHTVSRKVLDRAPTRQPNSAQLVRKVLEVIRKHAPKRKDAADLAAAIVAESKSQDFDPLFVAAVIKSESTFNALARSNKGAEGLMQIMPKTGAWLAEKEEIPRGRLTDPGYNLKLGVKYLKHLEEMYGGDRVFVLIAYNWGPGRVDSATDGKRRVPPEVVSYAVKIMNDFRRWQSTV